MCGPILLRPLQRLRQAVLALSLLSAILLPHAVLAQTETASAATEQEEKGVMIRIICVRSLTGDEEEAMLASKTEDEKWIEHGSITLRTPLITEWFRVSGGMTHLIRKEGKEIKSYGSFTVPPKAKRLMVILLPDKAKNIYRAQVIDPGNLGFKKGKTLLINYGNVPAMVKIADRALMISPGKQIVTDIDANKDGMYRLTIGCQDKNKNIIPCYDKTMSVNPQARKFILLFPGRKSDLRVMALSEFGPFE